MTDAPRSVASLRKLAYTYPSDEILFRLVSELSEEPNHRAATLGVVSLLEGALKQYLASKLIIHEKLGESDLFGSAAPLRAFSAKIKVGFAIGLFGAKTREDLHTIREVRNTFAHSMSPLSLDTPETAQVCKRITFPNRLGDVLNPKELVRPAAQLMVAASYLTIAFDHLALHGTLLPDNPGPDGEPVSEALTRAIAE